VFHHKKDMDRFHKLITRMKKPSTVDGKLSCKQLFEEFDVDPGLTYLLSGSEFDFFSAKAPFEINTKQEFSSPKNAWIRLVVPFDTNESLRKSYKHLETYNLREDRLMELLDYFTGRLAYKYTNFLPSQNEVTLVTASVDKIELFDEVSLDKPLIITSYPSYVGSTSMEIRADISNDPNDSDEGFLGTAYFMFAARDAKNYKNKMTIPQFNFEDLVSEGGDELKKAKLRFELGLEKKKERISESKNSLFKKPPNQEESEILHNLYLNYKNYQSGQNTIKGVHQKPIIETMIDKTQLMHSQNKNVHGKVFGGYVINKALELAWICAKIHCKYKKFKNICIDSVTFHKPVPVGSIATYKAIVVYVFMELMHVSVEVHCDMDGVSTLTTTINAIYLAEELVTEVVPTTYDCGLKYLEAKRRSEDIYSHF